MEFLLSLIAAVVIMVFSSNVRAENDHAPSQHTPNIMEVILFLNANQAKNGSASFQADHDKKSVEYFDQDGRIMEKSYLDANNDIVTQHFDKSGKVISEIKITEESIMGSIKQSQTDHEQKEAPELLRKLSALSAAAEKYAKANGKYPQHMKDLTKASPPYLTECTCGLETPAYRIVCDVNEAGYTFKANSLWSHLESYSISTGGKSEIIKRKPPFETSISTCE